MGAVIERELLRRGWTKARLARESRVDPNTIGDMIRGVRTASIGTRVRIEKVLEWPEGAITDLEQGRISEAELLPVPVVVTRTDESRGVSGRPRPGTVDLPPEVEAGLTAQQAAEVRAHAYAEAMRRRREIINGA